MKQEQWSFNTKLSEKKEELLEIKNKRYYKLKKSVEKILRKFSNTAKRQSSVKVKRTHEKIRDTVQGVQFLNKKIQREHRE